MNSVFHAPIEGPLALVVLDRRAGGGKNVFRLFNGFPLIGFIRQLERRNAVNLFRVEDVREANNGLVQLHLFFFRLAVRVQDGLALFVQLVLFFGELKIDHRRGLAAG